MDRDNIIERVRRLLALADSEHNENENEAEAAARIASKLMLEHKLEMSDIERSDFADYAILGCQAGERNIPHWRKRLLQVLAHYNFCEVILFSGPGARKRWGGTMFLIGHRDDATVVRMLYDHVFKQINRLRDRALEHLHAKHVIDLFGMDRKDVPELPRGAKLLQWKDQFNLGIVDGIYLSLEKMRHEAEQDENTRAIVRYADSTTRQFIESQIGEVRERTEKCRKVTNIGAYTAGLVAAELVDVAPGKKKTTARGYYLVGGNDD